MSESAATSNVAVMGGGRWASALAAKIAKNAQRGHIGKVVQYRSSGRGPEDGTPVPGVEVSSDLHALGGADVIFLATPAGAARQLLREASAMMHGGQFLIHAIGSLEPKASSLSRISDVVLQETPVRRIGALAGPALAQDLEQGRPAALLCGSRFDEVGAATCRILACSSLRVYMTRDLVGVEMARALVAAVALAAGVGHALDLGPAARAILVARGAAEMARLGVALGASERTFFGLAGIGELVVATDGRGSADFELGVALARGTPLSEAKRAIGRTCDGPTMVEEAYRLAQRYQLRMTLVTALHRWLSGERSTKQALMDLFSGDDTGE